MTKELIIVALTALGHPTATPADRVREALLATVIAEEGQRNDVDPLLIAAVIFRESSFNMKAIGKKGERGLMQLLPHGSALADYPHLAPSALESPRLNIALGTRHMARVRAVCGASAGSPLLWLSVYNGTQKCRPTRYSRAVIAAAAKARKAVTTWAAK